MFFQYERIRDNEDHTLLSRYDSRLSVVHKISDAMVYLTICSICGNWATPLAKKLYIDSKKYSCQRIAMVTVSQNPKFQEIRNDLIQQIGQNWMFNSTLILDGFWWELENKDFEAIGIPSPSESFRIVFTSGNADLCKKIGRHQIFHVDFLEDDEAWDLFREKAGKSIAADSYETARQIVNECDGFRFAVLTIASTLQDKPTNVWKDSLIKLQNLKNYFFDQKFTSDMKKVFSLIHLSYELLNMDAQLFFHLCCLFPEDFSIPVEDLVLFWKGLEIFGNVNSMCEARDQVECIIHKLKRSFFLLDGDEDVFVKVHPMCRDFGQAMSSNLDNPYVVSFENDMEEWPLKRTEYQNCRAISFMCETIEQHPVDLKCPNLHLLQLSYGIYSDRLPTGLFEGLTNLRVLSLSIPSLSQPLIVLPKLRTFCITESISDNRYEKPRPRIGDLLGEEMKELEILSFSTGRPYDDFPREMGLLHNLRFLRFNRERLKYIPQGVLSNLVKLEELYLPLDFISWGCKEEGGERMNASLGEIEFLPLTAIRIGAPKGSILAKKLVNNLKWFHVFIGGHVGPEYEFLTGANSKKVLEVFDVDADDFTVSWIKNLMWKSESLRLKQVSNLKHIISWKQKEGKNMEFPEWKKICISDCKEVEYLAAGRIPLSSFSQLRSLKLFGLCNLTAIWDGPCQK